MKNLIWILICLIPVAVGCNPEMLVTPTAHLEEDATGFADATEDPLFADAEELFFDSKYEPAIECLDQLLDKYPESAFTWCLRGAAYTYNGQPELGVADLEQALEFEPESSFVHLCLSETLSELDRYDEAMVSFNNAIRFNKLDEMCDESELYGARAIMLERSGKFKESLADYKMALKLDNTNAMNLNNYASLLSMSPVDEIRDAKEAIKCAKKAVKLATQKDDNEMLTYCWSTLGSAYAEAGDFEKAIKCASKAVEIAGEEELAEIESQIEQYKKQEPVRYPIEGSQSL